jgi:integrase
MGQGQLFQRTYKATDGTIRTCRTWTIRWYRHGIPFEESTEFTRKGDALNLLKLRNGDVAKGKPITPAQFKLTFDEAAKTVLDDFKANGKRSLAVVERRINKHLLPYFGGRRLSDISADHVLAYIAKRQADTEIVRRAYTQTRKDGTVRQVPEQRRTIARISNAEINRELQVLKRCFSLALKHGKIFTKPEIPMLRESAPRSGFFDRAQIEAVCRHLPADVQNLVRFGFITGWRMASEAQRLEWHQVDFAAGTVSLLPGTTKNRQGRTFKMTADLRRLLETQRAAADVAQREHTCVVPWVFFRLVAKGRRGPKQPKPITTFTVAWRHACRAAGLPGRIPHDLRRSSIRVMVRAGISTHVAMQLAGHRTPSIFRRYDIVSETDLTEAAAKLDAVNRDSSVTVAASTASTTTMTDRIA